MTDLASRLGALAAELEATPEDILDDLWLVAWGRALPEAPAAESGAEDELVPEVDGPREPAGGDELNPERRMPLHVPAPGTRNGKVPIPPPPSLTGGRAYIKALRQLRVNTPNRHRFHLEERKSV